MIGFFLRRFLPIGIVILIVSSCSHNKFDIDTNQVSVNLNIIRFDQEIFEPSPDSAIDNTFRLLKEYPEFSSIYFNHILKIGDPSSKRFQDLFTMFVTNYDYKIAYEAVHGLYRDFTPYKVKLADAFKHYKYYFPKKTIPDIYLMMTGFTNSIVTTEKTLGIGLDRFLGENSRLYLQLAMPLYKRERMKPEVIQYEAIRGWLYAEFPFNDSLNTLASNMVYHGKILYLMDAIFPEDSAHLKISYSPRDIEWCLKSQDDVWLYLMDKKLLFSTDRMTISKMTEIGPFTSPFTTKSPDRVGQWMGWQIVKAYMEQFPETTIPQLIENDNYHKILVESKFSP